MNTIPLHAYDLIEDLAKTYPEVIFSPGQDRDEFLMRQGERRLVLTLLNRQRRERDDSRRGNDDDVQDS